MLNDLKKEVCQANHDLYQAGLVIQTWGNVSGMDRSAGAMVIKPSGIPYGDLTPETMVVVSLDNEEVIEGDLRPSSDTATHLELYRAWKDVGGIVHTHSLYATSWSQACKDLPPLGTTHADFAAGPIPCTRKLKTDEISDHYEANTGKVIIEEFGKIGPLQVPACLVAEHGPFAWGDDAHAAVDHAVALEAIAQMACQTLLISPDALPLQPAMLEKHFRRKHGPEATYGQPK